MWKTIEERPNYQVSDSGEVQHISGRKVKKHLDKNGYYVVYLSVRHNKTVCRRVSRLVARAFIPNPNNLSQVNHKGERKTNDCVDNLEWCDCRYNINYGTRTERAIAHCKKPVIAYDGGKEVARYESASEAARSIGAWQSDISLCCRSATGSPKVHGLTWRYAKG